jgi:hypothetical protein
MFGDDKWLTAECLKGTPMRVGHYSASLGSLNKLSDAERSFLYLFDHIVNKVAHLVSCRKDGELQYP